MVDMSKVEWSEETQTISVGKAVFSIEHLCFVNTKGVFFHKVFKDNGLNVHYSSTNKTKEYRKALCDILGGSAAQLFKVFRGMALNKWFLHEPKEVRRAVVDGVYRVSQVAWARYCANRNEVLQAVKDGNGNLVPLLIHSGSTVQELCKGYGKGAWKKIAKKSFHWHRVCSAFIDVSVLKHVSPDCPTALLKYMPIHPYLLQFKGKWGDSREMQRESNICKDTYAMSQKLSLPFSIKWSARKMHEKHKEYQKILNAKRYSKEEPEWLQCIPSLVVGDGGYEAVLLKSAYAINEEGIEMGHCVGMYASEVMEQRYLVYSIRKDGERYSTLGLHRSRVLRLGNDADSPCHITWAIQQHYKRYNDCVDNEEALSLGQLVLETINK